MAAPIKVISYNMRGLCSPQKRGRLWQELRHLRGDVVFLQETHFVKDSIPKMPMHVFNQWFHAPSPIARATITFRKTCPMVVIASQIDPEGRFLFVKGRLHGFCYTFASIYAPNTVTVNFPVKTLKLLKEFREGLLMLGGDFNLTLDSKIDTPTGKTHISFKALKNLKQLLHSFHLVDGWRVTHYGKRDYNYYSKIHNTYSLLDMFLVDQFYLERTRSFTIEPITISDHASITVTFLPISAGHLERTWQLNESLLDDNKVVETLSCKIKTYFETNMPEEVSEQAVWEAHKSVIRGELIAHGSWIKKEKQKEIVDLLINELEIKHKRHLDPADSQQLEDLRHNLAQCLDRKVKNKHRYYAHRFYEQGNKCGWLLARQLKKQQESRHVHSLIVQNKKIVESQAIAAEFHKF